MQLAPEATERVNLDATLTPPYCAAIRYGLAVSQRKREPARLQLSRRDPPASVADQPPGQLEVEQHTPATVAGASPLCRTSSSTATAVGDSSATTIDGCSASLASSATGPGS